MVCLAKWQAEGTPKSKKSKKNKEKSKGNKDLALALIAGAAWCGSLGARQAGARCLRGPEAVALRCRIPSARWLSDMQGRRKVGPSP